jgi:hypothetical protein
MSSNGEEGMEPPPLSQSHFTKYENFIPDDDAAFEDEFARLASSQNWMPGSQEYTRERTIALREEVSYHYFPPSRSKATAWTREEILEGYQALCREVRIPAGHSIGSCKKRLKERLVNIVDLVNARRTLTEVPVWHDFAEFRNYTLEDGHTIDKEEAKRGEGILASLLQHLGPARRRRRRRGKGMNRVLSGRVIKQASS